MSEAEFNFWTTVLDASSVKELQYAFDCWNQNGRFFPKPKDITELVEAYRISGQKTGYPGCDAECRSRHGKGYHYNDIEWLFKRYMQMNNTRPMTEEEIDSLLAELDKKRGTPPAWRKA